MEKISGYTQEKNPKILLSAIPCSEKLKQYLGDFAIFHTSSVCEGVWKIAKPHKFGFSFSKQGIADIFKMHLFNTGPVVHLRVVQLELMATLFSTFYHFDQPLPCWRPPFREQYTVSLCRR